MKILFHILFVVICAGMAPGVAAQTGTVSVRVNRAELKGKALNLDADVRIAHVHVGRYESVSLTLVLKGAGKGQTLSLPPIIVCGANKLQMYRRTVALQGAVAAKKGAYDVLKNDPELIQFLSYKRAVAYKAWMNNCQLLLVREVKDYNNNTVQSSTKVIDRKLAIRGVSSPEAAGNPSGATANPANRPPTYRMPPANRTTPPAGNRPTPPAGTNRPNSRTTPPAGTNRQNSRPASTAAPATRRPASSSTTRPATTQANRRTSSTATKR
ncbi:MAG: DUF3868 domain-containing protein [Tannerellaceae bacterium]|jgi:hypothetical protein|nr:DUF3868 domain-containing protein [Tannerellaceae bacterium]